jgi:hypothetical protein
MPDVDGVLEIEMGSKHSQYLRTGSITLSLE